MTLSPAPVPEQEGLTQEWVSVQKVATKAMENAGGRALIHAENASYEEDARDVWEAMLAASPTPPAGRKATPADVLKAAKAIFAAACEDDRVSPMPWESLAASEAGYYLTLAEAALAAGGAA